MSQHGEPKRERTTRTATEARQGEIILGRRGRWVWIVCFALIVLLLLLTGTRG